MPSRLPLSSPELQMADALLSHHVDLFRLEASVRATVLDDLNALGSQLEALARSADLSAYSKARVAKLLGEVTGVIDDYYEKMQGRVEDTLVGIARSQGIVSGGSLSTLGIDPVGLSSTYIERIAENVIIQGAPSADWWARQAADVRFRFATAVRTGLLQGETNAQIVARLIGSPAAPGILNMPRKNVRSLVQTSVQAVANAASLESFQKNNDVITGLRQLSTLDSHTTNICIAYSDEEWDVNTMKPLPGSVLPFNGGPPRHWNCRSVLVPITKSFAELGVPIKEFPAGQRASSAGPISAQTTMAAFLTRKGAQWQDDVLGPGRAELWRKGDITLQQLVDLKGNPLTLAQLERKYGSP